MQRHSKEGFQVLEKELKIPDAAIVVIKQGGLSTDLLGFLGLLTRCIEDIRILSSRVKGYFTGPRLINFRNTLRPSTKRQMGLPWSSFGLASY